MLCAAVRQYGRAWDASPTPQAAAAPASALVKTSQAFLRAMDAEFREGGESELPAWDLSLF